MLAARLHQFEDIRVDSVPDPVAGPGEVVIDVACVQPSVTEAMLIDGERITLAEQLAARLRDGPIAFGGHEFAGVIRSAGPGVTGLEPGTRVTASETVTCGGCPPCRTGHPGSCTAPQYLGFTRPGAFAEQVLVPAANVVRIPDGVSASAAAAAQPLAGALHAHAAAAVAPGESVLVIGAGVMGLLAIQVARHGNAGTIIAAGRSPAKLELAARFGAERVLGAEADVPAEVLAATGDVGADVVIETAGGSESAGLAGDSTMAVAARSVRRGGRIVVVSVLGEDAGLPVTLLRERGIALLHPRSGGDTFAQALRLIARGDVDVESLVTHRLDGLDQLGHALEITRHKRKHGAINPAQVHTRHSW